MEQLRHRLRSKLEVDTEFGNVLGDTRIRLLEAIDTAARRSPSTGRWRRSTSGRSTACMPA